jgi:Lecithin retinol acyltransferase
MSIQPIGPRRLINLPNSSRFSDFYSDGIYLLNKPIENPFQKPGRHYGILIKGQRFLEILGIHDRRPIVIHKTNNGIYRDSAETYEWEILGQVPPHQITDAMRRMQLSLLSPLNYDLFINNCEHFARFVTTGKKESSQVQGVAVIGGLVLLLLLGGDDN